MDDGDFDLHLPRSRPWANDDAPFAGLIPTGGTERRHMYDKKKRKKKRAKKAPGE
jgi:hypothetical protein